MCLYTMYPALYLKGKGKHCCQLVVMLLLCSDQHKECVVFKQDGKNDDLIATWRHAEEIRENE